MKIHFWTIGKNHEPYIKAGVEEFTNRIGYYFPVEWTIIPSLKQISLVEEVKKNEADKILQRLQPEDYLVALDQRGKQFTSEQLADWINKITMKNVKHLVILIGGAYGLDERILRRANHVWSLSLLTFPHQLVRLLLAEQVYRACTIFKNEKYHH